MKKIFFILLLLAGGCTNTVSSHDLGFCYEAFQGHATLVFSSNGQPTYIFRCSKVGTDDYMWTVESIKCNK